jgi:hypothetical protein
MISMRASVAAAVLVGGMIATHSFKPKEAGGLQRPLGEFPSAIGFSHSEDRPFEQPVVLAIGADDYINRVYLGGTLPIELYIGFYKDFTLPKIVFRGPGGSRCIRLACRLVL